MAVTWKHEIITPQKAQEFGKDIAKISAEEIFASQETFRYYIRTGWIMVNNAINDTNPKLPNEELEKILVNLFRLVVKMREYLTGEKYALLVELEQGGSLGVSFDQLIKDQAIVFSNGRIEYSLNQLTQGIQIIQDYQKSYDSLLNRIFSACGTASAMDLFIYQHSDGNNAPPGHFFEEHFAHYSMGDSANTWYHFYIKERQQKVSYTSKTAKFYNRGHVYEWYMEDLNKGIERDASDAEAFMDAHDKDRVPFIQAGDITAVDNTNTIYAVQIKRFNNQKLMSLTQLRTTLNKLSQLTGRPPTKAKVEKQIKAAFTSKAETAKLNEASARKLNVGLETITANFGTNGVIDKLINMRA